MRSVANATDRVAGFRVKPANRFAVTAGQTYRAGALIEVAEYVAGAYEAQIDWFNASDVSLGTSTFQSLTAVTPRSPLFGNVTAPEGATKAAMRFGWTGATAEGTAYADSVSFVVSGLHGTLKDNQGAWGEQKIVDFSVSPPAVVGTYQSPGSKQWPPPTNGIYMPREARMFGNDLTFTTWMTDGLRVLDVSKPSAPKEVASFLPPAAVDPSPNSGAGPNNSAAGGPFLFRGFSWPTQRLITGVDVRRLSADSARIVLSDINGGVYVVDAAVRRSASGTAPPPPPPPPVAPVGTDRVAPRLSAFTVIPASFKAKSSGPSIAKTGGTRVRYRLSERAVTTFTVQRVEKGRKQGGRCQKPSPSNRRGASCTRYVKVSGKFTHSGVAGKLNTLRFSGRMAGRKLAVKRYRLRAVARDSAGNAGAARTAGFRIKR